MHFGRVAPAWKKSLTRQEGKDDGHEPNKNTE